MARAQVLGSQFGQDIGIGDQPEAHLLRHFGLFLACRFGGAVIGHSGGHDHQIGVCGGQQHRAAQFER